MNEPKPHLWEILFELYESLPRQGPGDISLSLNPPGSRRIHRHRSRPALPLTTQPWAGFPMPLRPLPGPGFPDCAGTKDILESDQVLVRHE